MLVCMRRNRMQHVHKCTSLHTHSYVMYLNSLTCSYVAGYIRGMRKNELRYKPQSTRYANIFEFNNIFTVSWPPLWSSGQSSWLQIQRSGYYSRLYQIFWEVVGLERGPLSLVSTFEELEIREYGRTDPSRWPRGTLHPSKLALTSPTSGFRSVGIFARGLTPRNLLFLFTISLYLFYGEQLLFLMASWWQ
jgi:hypothetical protein